MCSRLVFCAGWVNVQKSSMTELSVVWAAEPGGGGAGKGTGVQHRSGAARLTWFRVRGPRPGLTSRGGAVRCESDLSCPGQSVWLRPGILGDSTICRRGPGVPSMGGSAGVAVG